MVSTGSMQCILLVSVREHIQIDLAFLNTINFFEGSGGATGHLANRYFGGGSNGGVLISETGPGGGKTQFANSGVGFGAGDAVTHYLADHWYGGRN